MALNGIEGFQINNEKRLRSATVLLTASGATYNTPQLHEFTLVDTRSLGATELAQTVQILRGERSAHWMTQVDWRTR